MPRTIVATPCPREPLSSGVELGRFHPGGKIGPNGEVLSPFPGGQVWSEMLMLGGPDDAIQLVVPDIRLPANQYWPLHWHDCWVGIVILEGNCLIGDWWMEPGDVLITAASLEYGPLLIGPEGCRMFEIFAQAHLLAGGYSPEYRDHPTLQDGQNPFNFVERSPVNQRNTGRQTLPLDGVEGFTKGRLIAGAQWDLGESTDPDRGVMSVCRLSPGERLAARSHDDWYAILVFDGTATIDGRTLGRDDYLLIRPQCHVAELRAGTDGALLLELSRTARGMAGKQL